MHKRLNVDPFGDHVDGGQDGDGNRSEKEADGVQQTDLQASEYGRNQRCNQNVILECKDIPVAVTLDPSSGVAIVKQSVDKLVQDAIWANPVAEEPSQE